MAYGPQGNSAVAKHRSGFGQDSDAVIDLHVDVVAGFYIAEVGDRQTGVGGFTWRTASMDFIACCADNVAKNRRCGRCSAGAVSIKHETTSCFCFNKNGVEGFIHAGQGVAARDEGGMYSSGNGFLPVVINESFANGEKFDGVAS